MSLQPDASRTPLEDAHNRERKARAAAEQALEDLSLELGEAQRTLAEERRRLQRAEANLEATRARLVESERMATVGRLAIDFAREINDPLAFINSNLTTLTDYCVFVERTFDAYEALADAIRSGGSDQLPSLIDSIDALSQRCDPGGIVGDAADVIAETSHCARRVAEVLGNLQSVSGFDDEGTRAVDLNDCVAATLRIARSELRPTCEIEERLEPLPPVECNAAEITQVLLSLVVNASRAIADSGRISVATQALDEGVEITVADDGRGMSPDVLARLFDPLLATKDPHKGRGLGLPLSQAIVRKYGGSLDVESEVGRGTTFRILLPLQPPKREAA